jgi:hypothetical protein
VQVQPVIAVLEAFETTLEHRPCRVGFVRDHDETEAVVAALVTDPPARREGAIEFLVDFLPRPRSADGYEQPTADRHDRVHRQSGERRRWRCDSQVTKDFFRATASEAVADEFDKLVMNQLSTP